MEKDIATSAAKQSVHDDVHKTDRWLVTGGAEIERIGDIVSGPQTVVEQEPLDMVLFLYVIEGSARVTLSDVGVRTLAPNDALTVFPWRVATVELTAPANRLMLMTVRGRDAVDASLRLGYWDLMGFSAQYAGNFMGEIIDRFHASPLRGRDPHVQGLAEHLLETIWLRARNGSRRVEIFDVIRTVNRLPVVGLTTDSASTALGVSRTKLNTLFLSGLGLRPGEYISRIVLARSLAALFWTRQSVAQIAEKMGFSSASALAVFLRRRIGLTPAEFRINPFSAIG